MRLTKENVVHELLRLVPEARDLVEEHLDFHEELLLHLLFPDLLRLAVQKHHDGSHDVSRRILDFASRAVREGDGYVENAVFVSFIEGAGYGEGETDDFLATWPTDLERERVAMLGRPLPWWWRLKLGLRRRRNIRQP